jgi:hypothetical protein
MPRFHIRQITYEFPGARGTTLADQEAYSYYRK